MATIIDVAKLAGVSIKTVSRVMNNHSYVSEATRKRVDAAMQELAYAPSEAARRMRTGKSQLVGMLYGDPSSGYQSRLNHAMLQACSAAGTFLVAGLFDEAGGEWRSQLEAFLDRTKADRMVLVPPLCDSTILQDVLEEREISYALISPSRSVARAPAVAMDDHLAAYEITKYIIELGHSCIAHIAGDPAHVASLLRRQGFEEALHEAGLWHQNDQMIREGAFDFRKALVHAEGLLKLTPRPTAIFAASDDMAAAVYIMAGKLGLSIPEDLSVVGFDDTPIAQTIWPNLTTVAQPFDAMAAKAVALINRPSDDKAIKAAEMLTTLPHKIVYRDSCAPVRG